MITDLKKTSSKIVFITEILDATHFAANWRGQIYECRSLYGTGGLLAGQSVICYTLEGSTELIFTDNITLPGAASYSDIIWVMDGGGSALVAGIAGDLAIDFNCTIIGYTLLADAIGGLVVDVWKSAYASFPPTVANSLTGVTPPTLVAAAAAQDWTLAGWTTIITAGDVLRFNINSAATITKATLALKVMR